jgi:hypothetical protein
MFVRSFRSFILVHHFRFFPVDWTCVWFLDPDTATGHGWLMELEFDSLPRPFRGLNLSLVARGGCSRAAESIWHLPLARLQPVFFHFAKRCGSPSAGWNSTKGRTAASSVEEGFSRARTGEPSAGCPFEFNRIKPTERFVYSWAGAENQEPSWEMAC